MEEGPEGIKQELVFAFFRGWEIGFCALGLGIMKKKTNKENWDWDFNLSNKGWDLKNIGTQNVQELFFW